MDKTVAERAQQLFLLADQERKGFIIKRDMQRMRSEVPMSPDQLEAVFDSLDVHGNRYLTMQQFLCSFGEQEWGATVTTSSQDPGDKEYCSESGQDVLRSPRLAELLALFHEAIPCCGLQELCRDVQLEGSGCLLESLVTFLEQLWCELDMRRSEMQDLRQANYEKDHTHRTEMLKLCEDLENQMKEKETLLKKGEERAAAAGSALSQQLKRQETLLLQVQDDHQQMSARVHELESEMAAARCENAQLLASKLQLEHGVQQSEERNQRLQQCVHNLRVELSLVRRDYTSLGFQLARSILTEQQGLQRQLQLLQSISATLEDGSGVCSEASSGMKKQRTDSADRTDSHDYEYDEDFHEMRIVQEH